MTLVVSESNCHDYDVCVQPQSHTFYKLASGIHPRRYILTGMNISDLLAGIDQEIARLQRARDLLSSDSPQKRRGRPPGSATKKAAKSTPSKKRSGPSAAGRKRIAEAQRKRWAARKKAAKKATPKPAVKKVAAKREPVKRTKKATTKPGNALSSRSDVVPAKSAE
jgi:hypothetical protein